MRKPTHLFYGLVFSFLWLSISTSAQTTTASFTICLGQSLALPDFPDFPRPPQGPAGPDGMLPFVCTPQINAVTFTPEMGIAVNDLQNVVVSPTQSTTFTVIISGSCGAPGLGFFSDEMTFIYEVIVDQSCAADVTEVFTICPGESVRLPAAETFPTPPQGPAGPDGFPITPCTPQLTEVQINPTTNATASSQPEFIVAPTTSTIYEVTSLGFCGAPGIGANSDEITRRYAVLIDENCAGDITETFTICLGESIFLPAEQTFPTPPLGSAGPNDGSGGGLPITPCTPQLTDISINPQANAVANGTDGFTVTPTTSTIYEVTSNGFCGAPGITPQSDEITFRYEVLIDQSCSPNTPSTIFSDFPWLSTLVNPTDCSIESIEVYQQGIFSFLLIQNEFGEEQLYFENGQFYCQNSANYDCVAAYGLGAPITIWNCGDLTSQLPDCSAHFGQVFFEECDDNGLFYFIRLSDGRVIDPYFANGIDFNPQEGQEVNFDYVIADFATPCSIAEAAVLVTCIEEADPGVIVIEDGDGDVFSTFPWLAQLLNPTACNAERISVYQSGIFQFVFVEFNNEHVLYFEDGTRYCADAANYDCRALYNLGSPIATWTCGAGFSPVVTERISTSPSVPTTLNVYPNPSTGPLTVQLSGQQEAQQLRLYDLYGRLLQEVQVADNSGQQTLPFDISAYAKGIYLLEWQSGTARKVEKIIKE